MKRLARAFKAFGIVGGLAFWGLAVFVLIVRPSQSDNIIIPNVFSTGQVADPAQVNANFDTIATIVNGRIDDDNWDPSGPGLQGSHMASQTITAANVANGTLTATQMAANAVHSISASGTGDNTADTNLTGVETRRVPQSAALSYTLASGSAGVMILSGINYYVQCPSSGNVHADVRLYIDNVLKATKGIGCLTPSADSSYHYPPLQFSWYEEGLGAGSHTFEIRDIKDVATNGNITYIGTGNKAGWIKVIEVKR